MAAARCKGLMDKLAHEASIERETRALKRQGSDEMVPVKFEWQRKQTKAAVLFPSYGWVPIACLAWTSAKTGEKLPWSLGHESDQLLMVRRFAEGAGR